MGTILGFPIGNQDQNKRGLRLRHKLFRSDLFWVTIASVVIGIILIAAAGYLAPSIFTLH